MVYGKKVVILLFSCLILFSFLGFADAQELPFEINTIAFHSQNIDGNIQTGVGINNLGVVIGSPAGSHLYLNGFDESVSEFQKDRYNFFPNLLKVGENRIISISNDLILNSGGEIVSQWDGRRRTNYGPTAGTEIIFSLTQEEVNSILRGESVEITSFSSKNPIFEVPSFRFEFAGDLVHGRTILLDLDSAYNSEPKNFKVYFNENFVKEFTVPAYSQGGTVFSLEEVWISNEDFNVLTIEDSGGRRWSKFIYPYYPYDTPEGFTGWAGIIGFNDSAVYYGETVSVFGLGFESNKEYKVGINYDAVPGGRIKVMTNDIGEFHLENFEIKPPLITSILLWFKNWFTSNPDEEFLSEEEIYDYINNLEEVNFVVVLEDGGGGVGRGIDLCDKAPENIKELYCNI